MIVVEDQEVVITVKGKNVTFRMSTNSSDRGDTCVVPESPKSPKRTRVKRSFESQNTSSTVTSSRHAFDQKSREYDVPPYAGHALSCDASTGRTPHRDPFESIKT
jgi:hypothetical protein